MKPYGLKTTKMHPQIKKGCSGHPDGCVCKPRYTNRKGLRKLVKMELHEAGDLEITELKFQ